MQLVRAMAEAWSGAGITANAIAPGSVPTALTGAVFEDAARVQAIQAQTAAGRVGELADLQGAAIYLCSPASNYVTGQTLYGPFTDPLRTLYGPFTWMVVSAPDNTTTEQTSCKP